MIVGLNNKVCPNKKLVKELIEFYNIGSNVEKYNNIYTGNISKKFIEWYCTLYCYKYKKDIFNSFINMIKKYTVLFFNIDKINNDTVHIFYDDFFIASSVGELNFYKWLIENGIYDKINNNKGNLQDLMKNCYKSNKIKDIKELEKYYLSDDIMSVDIIQI